MTPPAVIAPPAPTVTQISHPLITEANFALILGIILGNIEADAPAIIQISPTAKTVTIVSTILIGLSATLAILQALESAKAAAA